jgi:hypothetical protein
MARVRIWYFRIDSKAGNPDTQVIFKDVDMPNEGDLISIGTGTPFQVDALP